MSRAWLLLMAAGMMLPAALRAQPSAAGGAVRWVAPAGCPDEARVRQLVADAEGTRGTSAAALAVDVAVTRQGASAYTAKLRFRAPIEGERELAGDSCESLAAAAAWLIAEVSRSASVREPAPLQPRAARVRRSPGSPGSPRAPGKDATSVSRGADARNVSASRSLEPAADLQPTAASGRPVRTAAQTPRPADAAAVGERADAAREGQPGARGPRAGVGSAPDGAGVLGDGSDATSAGWPAPRGSPGRDRDSAPVDSRGAEANPGDPRRAELAPAGDGRSLSQGDPAAIDSAGAQTTSDDSSRDEWRPARPRDRATSEEPSRSAGAGGAELARSSPEAGRARAAPPLLAAGRAELVLWGGVDLASQPTAAAGPGVELAWVWPRLRLALRPRLFLAFASAQPDERSGLRVRASLAELPVQACYGFRPLGGWLGVCASAVPGLVWASARGAPATHSARGGAFTVEAALSAGLPLARRLTLRLELSLARPVVYPRLSVEPLGVVHEAPPLLVRLGLGLGLHF